MLQISIVISPPVPARGPARPLTLPARPPARLFFPPNFIYMTYDVCVFTEWSG